VSVDIRVPCYDDREQAPIHVAASEGHYETVFTLLDACGSDVNVRDSEGESPLHCAALREYDPLGMKSKDDYTETVKVLLNFGAEVNFRNARGETALHLAARNELQKVVEVLVLAGGDPLAEDNDRNKPIDLVVPEDTVSKQTLKTAMADRERIMNEAREIRAKGFTTSLQRELPLSVRSQSTLQMPLAGMQGALMSSRYMSHTGIFQPPTGMSNMSHNQSGMMQTYGNHSGSRTSSSADSSKRRSDVVGGNFGGPRLPQSMLNTSAGHLNVGVPPTGRPVAAMRKARSVEELDQPRVRQQDGDDGRHPQTRGRKTSFQGSEVSSIWNVTPPGSVNELDLDAEQAETRSKKSGRLRKVPKAKTHENVEEVEASSSKKKVKKPQPPPPPTKPKTSRHAVEEEISDGNESEEYFLDDDDDASSVDDLDVEVRPSGRAKKHGKPLPAVPEKTSSKRGAKKKSKTDKAPKEKASAQTWLDEQARILKERNRSEAVNPVAHSTPPVKTRNQRRKDLPSSSGSGSSTESSSDSSSESSSDSDAPKGPPPPPPSKTTAKGKPKPPPPPKPSKDAKARHAPPLVQMENPGVGEMIQLDVDETQPEAQTVISIIPVNPPGPPRVQKVPHGSSSSTFVNLSKNATDSPPTPSKHKKPVPGGQKSRQPEPAGRSKNDKPVPRPRESKPTSPSVEKAQPRMPGKKVPKQQEPVAEKSESSPDFSDGDDEPVPTISSQKSKPVVTPTKPQAASRPSDRKQAQHKPGLIFEKATGDDNGNDDRSMETATVGRLRKPSDNILTASLNTSTGSDRSAGHTSFDTPTKWQKQPDRRQHPPAAQSDEDEEDLETETDDDSESDEDETSVPTTADIKTVIYVSDGKSSLGYTLVGGNTKGVFVDTIDPESAPASAGLAAGDHILRVNGQLMVGKTRDDVYHALHDFDGQLTLIVRHKPNLCQRVAEAHGGAGDSLFVRALFSVEAAKKGELNVDEGDVFDVVDTLPEGSPGYWRARKVDSATGRRTSEMGHGPLGLIPSRAKADQIVVKQNLAHGKPGPNDRGGLFFRSFRRAKSATRNGGRSSEGDDDRRLSGLDVISYERVTRKISDARRPVIVLGLFCDTIRTMLVRDSPGLFVVPADEVETPKDEIPVNVKPILAVSPTKHCLLILSPPAIEYLQQRTDINPLTIYVSPVSKSVVKAVKTKLAPAYNKNPGYMYEEAAKFEKNYAHLFSATVPYTVDDAWFFNIKGVVERLQNQPTWMALSQSEIDAAAAAEAKKYLPPMPVAVALRTGRAANPAVRMSRTTDDLPDVQSTKRRAEPPASTAVPSKNVVTAPSRSLNPNPVAAQVSRDSGGPTPPALAPAQKTVPKSRGQSTSSLDKSLTSERSQASRANPATVNPVCCRPTAYLLGARLC